MAQPNIYPALQIGQGDTAAFLAGADVAGASSDREMRNRLLERQMAAEEAEAQRQATYSNLLTQYMGPEEAMTVEGAMATPDRGEVLNQLYQLDPERTAKVVEHEQAVQEFERKQHREFAQEQVARMEFVLGSDSPANALRLASRHADGFDLLEYLEQEGTIDTSDGIDDDEARIFAQAMIMDLQPYLEADKERAEPALIREMRAIGIDPMTTEGKQTWLDLKMREGATDAELERLKLDMTKAQFEREQRLEAETERTAEQHRQVAKVELGNSAKYLAELADLNAKLASTWARSGSIGLDQRRVAQMTRAELGEVLGIPQDEARKVISWLDRANKLSSELLIQSLGRVAGSGMGQLTNDRLRLSSQTMPGMSIDPRANNLLIADKLDELITIGEIEGIEIPEAEQYRQMIETLRSDEAVVPGVQPALDVPGAARGAASAAGAAAAQVADLARMSREQIEQFNVDEIAQFNDEQRRALDKRLSELGL